MRKTIRLLAAATLLLGSAANAAPIFSDQSINNAFANIDVAGIHFADTMEQVHATMRARGWTAEDVGRALPLDSFEDAVRREVSKRTGVAFVARKTMPWNEWYRKGAQTLELEYRAHSKGALVVAITYEHAGVDDGPALQALRAEASRKFNATALVPIGSDTFCLPVDSKCFRGDPDLPNVHFYENTVRLRPGHAVDKLFHEDFDAAVAKALGPQDISL
jgi:hypothetical protein